MKFDKEQKKLLLSKFKTISYNKGDYILKAGEVEDKMYFVEEGVSRFWVYRGDREITYFFAFPGDFSTSYESFRKKTPSRIYHQCVTDVTLSYITAEDLHQLIVNSPEMNKIVVPFLEEAIFEIIEHQIDVLAFSAEEHYQLLIEQHEKYMQMIPQKLLATYLGITPEALSRIRKRQN